MEDCAIADVDIAPKAAKEAIATSVFFMSKILQGLIKSFEPLFRIEFKSATLCQPPVLGSCRYCTRELTLTQRLSRHLWTLCCLRVTNSANKTHLSVLFLGFTLGFVSIV